MIQTNGYYLDEPRYYEDFIGGNKVSGYHHYGYYFKNNEDFLIGYKKSKETEEFFKIEDFVETQKNKYEIIDNNKIKLIFNYDKEWQHEHTLFIKNKNSIIDGERILIFKKW